MAVLDIGGPFYVSPIYGKWIGTVIGGSVAFVGLTKFLFGLRKKRLVNFKRDKWPVVPEELSTSGIVLFGFTHSNHTPSSVNRWDFRWLYSERTTKPRNKSILITGPS